MRRRRGRRWPRRHPGAAARETTRVVEARAAERHNDVVMAATRGFHIWRSAAVSIHVCAVIVAAIQGEGAIGARHAGEQVDAQHSRDLEKVLRRRFWPQLCEKRERARERVESQHVSAATASQAASQELVEGHGRVMEGHGTVMKGHGRSWKGSRPPRSKAGSGR